MNYRSIAIGIASLSLVAICMAVVLLLGVASGTLLNKDEVSQSVKIATVAPLAPPVAFVTQEPDSPSEVVPAALKQQPEAPMPTPEVTFTATTTPSPAATPTPPTTASPTLTPLNGLATRLVIPKLSLDRPVIFAPIENQTWRVDHLGQSVGYLEGTAPPGSNSNLVLAGHVTFASGEYGPFAGLAQLAPGDVVTVHEGDEVFNYVIDGLQVVDRLDIEVVYPTETGQITLITCTNWDSRQGRYDDRVVVRGRLVPS